MRTCTAAWKTIAQKQTHEQCVLQNREVKKLTLAINQQQLAVHAVGVVAADNAAAQARLTPFIPVLTNHVRQSAMDSLAVFQKHIEPQLQRLRVVRRFHVDVEP